MFRTKILFAKAGDQPSPGQSGGRGSESQPPAAAPVVAGGFLPLGDPTFPVGQPVTLCFENGAPATGFKDPVYGFMDARGVILPTGITPTGWKLLP